MDTGNDSFKPSRTTQKVHLTLEHLDLSGAGEQEKASPTIFCPRVRITPLVSCLNNVPRPSTYQENKVIGCLGATPPSISPPLLPGYSLAAPPKQKPATKLTHSGTGRSPCSPYPSPPFVVTKPIPGWR